MMNLLPDRLPAVYENLPDIINTPRHDCYRNKRSREQYERICFVRPRLIVPHPEFNETQEFKDRLQGLKQQVEELVQINIKILALLEERFSVNTVKNMTLTSTLRPETITRNISIINLPDGFLYIGTISNGKPDGNGYEYSSDGKRKRFQGEYKNGNREGKGIEYFPDGRKFEGVYKNDRREGKGTIHFPNGRRFEVSYKNGKPEGKCIDYYPDGRRFEGVYKNGKPEGKYTCYMPDGQKFVSEKKLRKKQLRPKVK